VSYNPDAPSFCLQEVQGFQEPSSGLGLTELPAAVWILYRRQLRSNVCLYRRYAAIHNEKTIMISGSASSEGRVLDALSGRPKVAIVTGGSSGIGLEMVKKLIEKGYRVVATSRKITSAMTLHSTDAGVPASLANLTKAGLESVTRALAIEFAAEGIRFNAIAPGVANTQMNPVEAHEFLRQLSPLKRLAEVGEVADLLLYLESAQFVNGEVVHLDGGAHAGKW